MQGSFLKSVERNEITVMVGGSSCTEIGSGVDDNNTVSGLFTLCIPCHNKTSLISFSMYAYHLMILQME